MLACSLAEPQPTNIVASSLDTSKPLLIMFYGSDTHAEAAAAIFSVIASCRLHRLDPFAYLDEILRVLPHWPRHRYLELAPKYWAATRGRLRPEELAAPLSAFEVPPETQAPSDARSAAAE